MTEHILNFSIALDDEGIKKAVQDKAEKEIINDIKVEVMKKLFSSRYYNGNVITNDRYGNQTVSNDADLSSFSEKIIKETLEQYKSDIIERAAQLLRDFMKRSKAVKDSVNKVIEETKEE